MMTSFEQNSFLTGTNSAFIEDLYGRYLADPDSVNADWRAFFVGLDDETPMVARALKGANWVVHGGNGNGNGAAPKQREPPEPHPPDVRYIARPTRRSQA